MPKATTAELIDLAISAEKAAEELYRGLEANFAHHKDVAAFWREYAEEEAMHAAWLERLRDSLPPERLSALADPGVLEEATRALQIPVKRRLQGVHNLEDAYQLVHELENSETNAVFDCSILSSVHRRWIVVQTTAFRRRIFRRPSVGFSRRGRGETYRPWPVVV